MASVRKTFFNRMSFYWGLPFSTEHIVEGRRNDKVITAIPGQISLVFRNEDFMELFARPYADYGLLNSRRECIGQISDLYAWDFGNEDFPPPSIRVRDDITKSHTWSSVTQKRVILGSVTGISATASAASRRNSGTTLPLEPATLPYRTTANRVPDLALRWFAAINILSAASLLAP
jgi:hypothetical protein